MSISVVNKFNNQANRDFDIRNSVNSKPYWLKVKTRDIMGKLRHEDPNAAGKINPEMLREEQAQDDGFFKGRDGLVEMMIRATRENEAEVERMRGGKGRKETVLGGGANFMP